MNTLTLIALAILTAPDAREGETIRIDSQTVCMRNEPRHAVCVTDLTVINPNRFRIVRHHGRTVYVYPRTIVIPAQDLASLGTDILPTLTGLL